MNGVVRHQGVLAPLREDNINTDAIIPSREMRQVSKTGLAEGLFAGRRYVADRMPNPDFVLNAPDFAGASLLLSGKNFGCGSSREHAVWALREFGIRAVLAESFGQIFFDNCVANGIVPVRLAVSDMDRIAAWSFEAPQLRQVTVDLEAMTVTAGPVKASFTLATEQRRMLMNGESPIDVTLRDGDAVDTFEMRDRAARPWLYSAS